jgi:flavodoxin
MKKFLSIIIMAPMILTSVACGSSNGKLNNVSQITSETARAKEKTETVKVSASGNTQNAQNTKTDGSHSNILIVYFSRVGVTNFSNDVDVVSSASLNAGKDGLLGNAQIIANTIKEQTNGDVFQIKTVDSYPSGYRDTTNKAADEKKANARPKLVSHVDNIDAYKTIFLVYPNWWGTIPMPVYSFLEEYNLSGKTIIPCCTHEGSAMGNSKKDIASVSPNAKLLDGLAIRGGDVNSEGAKKSITNWIKKSGI